MSETPNIPAARLSVQIEPLLLNKTEAAALLHVSLRYFDDLVLAGLIGKVKIGGKVLYALEELRAFVQQVRRDGLSKSRIEDLIEKGKAARQSLQCKRESRCKREDS